MRMIGTFCAFMRLMISSLCCGDGGMPGFGSRNPTTSSENAFAKFGHELWYVTIFAPLERREARRPARLGGLQLRLEVREVLRVVGRAGRVERRQLRRDRAGDHAPVVRVEPVVRVPVRVDVAHRARDLPRRLVEDVAAGRRVEVARARRAGSSRCAPGRGAAAGTRSRARGPRRSGRPRRGASGRTTASARRSAGPGSPSRASRSPRGRRRSSRRATRSPTAS